MRHSLALFLLITLIACSSPNSPNANSDKSATVEEMYGEAKTTLKEENWESAIKKLEALQSRYPYGRYAQQAQLEIAYAYYKQKEVDSAISSADRFIKQYPNNPHVDYAYYLKGLANFHGESGFFGLLGDPTERDPKAAQDAFDAFKDMIVRFPDSKYAPDARLRMHYLTNALAKYDVHVASYYQRRGAYVGAVNRAKEVLSQYPDSPSSRDALRIMVQSYAAMGLNDLSKDAQRVLDMNTPPAPAAQVDTSLEQLP